MTCESDKSLDLRKHPNNPENRESIIESRRGLFEKLGFSKNFVEQLEENNKTLRTKKSIQNKIDGLKERGFNNPVKMITSHPAALHYTFKNIDKKIDGLKERGFKNPAKMITSFPAVLSYTFENIDEKIDGLKERGFKNPIKMITSFTAILGLAFENIDKKINELKERGFNNPVKIITSNPTILGLAFKNIDNKINGLRERGFKDPVKMITSLPAVLGYTFENIENKINGLKERGFKNPIKMIIFFTAILGLAFKNIDRKLNMLKKLVEHYDLNLDPINFIEGFPSFLGFKMDKIWCTARIINEKVKSTDEATKPKISKLLIKNLEDLIMSGRTKTSIDLKSLISEAKKIKEQQLSKEEKRLRISALPDNDKLKKRYFRGYPMKDG